MPRAMVCDVRPIRSRIAARLAWSRNSWGMPCSRNGVVTPASLRVCSSTAPQPPISPLSSMLTTSRCSRASSTIAGSTGLTQRGSTTVTPMPWATSRSATSTATSAIAPDADDQHVAWRRCARARRRRRPCRPPAMSSGGAPLGNRTHRRRVVDLDGLVEQLAQAGDVARGGQPQAGHHLQHRHVPHAVVAGSVVAGDAGAVEHEGHPAPVQRDVHQHLVEGPVEERGVDRHDRVQPAHRQAGGRGGGVLLGDADVERALGEPGLELVAARPGASSPR